MVKGIAVFLLVLALVAGCARLTPPIVEENKPPVAGWTALRDGTMPPYQWRFAGDGAADSYDPDGSIVAYIWRINGETFREPVVVYQFPQRGEYLVSLTVIDDDGATASLAWPGVFSVDY